MLRKKDYPATVKYGRKLYELHLTPVLLDGDKKDHDVRGFFQAADGVKRIVLHNKLSRKLLFETYLHECLHLIEHAEGFDIPHHIIEKLEAPLARLLIENFNLEFKKRS